MLATTRAPGGMSGYAKTACVEFYSGWWSAFPDAHVEIELTPSGKLAVHASGLEQILGLPFCARKPYALESSTRPGRPTSGTDAIVRVRAGRPAETVYSGLVFRPA